MNAPNILFMMADDHAAKAISAYGEGINKTPNIDRIANEGIRPTLFCHKYRQALQGCGDQSRASTYCEF